MHNATCAGKEPNTPIFGERFDIANPEATCHRPKRFTKVWLIKLIYFDQLHNTKVVSFLIAREKSYSLKWNDIRIVVVLTMSTLSSILERVVKHCLILILEKIVWFNCPKFQDTMEMKIAFGRSLPNRNVYSKRQKVYKRLNDYIKNHNL